MIYVISEPEYETSNWYKQIIGGLLTEKRKKRYSLEFIKNLEEIKSQNIQNTDVIFVVGTNRDWILSSVSNCEIIFSNRVVVLGNHERSPEQGIYSVVSGDTQNDIKILYSYLLSYEKKKIALYGINPDSTSDCLRKESFLALGGKKSDLFYNDSSLAGCYEKFKAADAVYDGVICVNDFAAFSLIKHYDKDKLPFITSCGGTMLSMFFSTSVTQMRTDYQAFGKSAFALAKMLTDENINSIDIRLAGEFSAGQTTDFLPLKSENPYKIPQKTKLEDKFYADSEIDEMLKIEALLNSCDLNDLYLIDCVISGKKYTDIANELFMSENGIKYRLKNMYKICDTASKKEFIKMLKNYIKASP